MKKLLIVDDSVFMRKFLNISIFKLDKVKIVGLAKDGIDALKMMEKHMPDIVTLDITMPNLDGIGFLRKVKEIKKDIIVIVATALKDKKIALEAISLGATSLINKPFTPQQITDEILKYI